MTSVIACFLAYVAFQQWRTNRGKLKLDLYEKRFQVYSNTLSFLQCLDDLQIGKRSDEFRRVHQAFIKSTRESQFLFSKESTVFEILEKINVDSFRVIGFKEHRDEFSEMGYQEALSKMAADSLNSLLGFESLTKKLEAAMSPYLKFHDEAT